MLRFFVSRRTSSEIAFGVVKLAPEFGEKPNIQIAEGLPDRLLIVFGDDGSVAVHRLAVEKRL